MPSKKTRKLNAVGDGSGYGLADKVIKKLSSLLEIHGSSSLLSKNIHTSNSKYQMLTFPGKIDADPFLFILLLVWRASVSVWFKSVGISRVI